MPHSESMLDLTHTGSLRIGRKDLLFGSSL
jgi:hypothetical protein